MMPLGGGSSVPFRQARRLFVHRGGNLGGETGVVWARASNSVARSECRYAGYFELNQRFDAVNSFLPSPLSPSNGYNRAVF